MVEHVEKKRENGEIINPKQVVVIVMGSEKDQPHVDKITEVLGKFGIQFELHVASAHKTPEHTLNIIRSFDKKNEGGKEEDGLRQVIFIAVAGRSNALGGFIDANSPYPVINCPPTGEPHTIYSSLEMPSGVGAVTVLYPEAAALSAAKILALSNPELAQKVADYQEQNRQNIISADQKLNST